MRERHSASFRTPIANGILWVTAAHLAVSAAIFILWRVSGDDSKINLFFKYQGSLFTVLCAAVEMLLAWTAFHQFSAGEPLRIAWLLITFSSFYRFIGYLSSQILDAETGLNPIYFIFGPQSTDFYQACHSFGEILSGPISMAVLAVGLFLILRTLRRLDMIAPLRPLDYGIIAVIVLFSLRQIYEIAGLLRTVSLPHDLHKVLGWPSDPLLSILLIEAILIRKSAASTEWGLLAKSWGAFSLAIILTLLGDLGIWVTWHNYVAYPYNSLGWYVWFLASAAFALGPAYQVEACRHAYHEAERISANPGTPASLPD
jgi:hypothetical protein